MMHEVFIVGSRWMQQIVGGWAGGLTDEGYSVTLRYMDREAPEYGGDGAKDTSLMAAMGYPFWTAMRDAAVMVVVGEPDVRVTDAGLLGVRRCVRTGLALGKPVIVVAWGEQIGAAVNVDTWRECREIIVARFPVDRGAASRSHDAGQAQASGFSSCAETKGFTVYLAAHNVRLQDLPGYGSDLLVAGYGYALRLLDNAPDISARCSVGARRMERRGFFDWDHIRDADVVVMLAERDDFVEGSEMCERFLECTRTAALAAKPIIVVGDCEDNGGWTTVGTWAECLGVIARMAAVSESVVMAPRARP